MRLVIKSYWCQFDQHFMKAFFVQKSFRQLFSSYVLAKKALSYEKSARKMLMKLTPGVDFINILRTAFTHVDPECAKKTVKAAVSFGTFGTYQRKSCT